METNYTVTKTQATIEVYEKPSIEIIEMEIESCLLAGSGDNLGGGGGTPNWH